MDTENFLEGFYDPEALTLHPLNYALGIANAASEAGVRIFENSRVLGYSKADPALVRTANGSVKASHIVLACNGYLGDLEPRSAGKIMPINNFMIATEPLGEERALELIKTGGSASTTRASSSTTSAYQKTIGCFTVAARTIGPASRATSRDSCASTCCGCSRS